jgi:hypothetical protein
VILYIDEGVCGAEIDPDVVGKQVSEKSFKHESWFWKWLKTKGLCGKLTKNSEGFFGPSGAPHARSSIRPQVNTLRKSWQNQSHSPARQAGKSVPRN